MNNQQKLLSLLKAKDVALTDVELIALDRCFGKRGAYKGYLTKNPPNSRKFPLANAIYQAITPNPYKLQICNLMFMSDDCKDTYNKLEPFQYPDWLDLDKSRLKEWGAW